MAIECDVGDEKVLTATFRDEEGVLKNPDPVIFRYTGPDGIVVSDTWTLAVPGTNVVNDSVGVFTARVPITIAGGYYSWHWLGQGVVKAAQESDEDTMFHVRTTGFPAIP
jgi:hypothetical protein